MTPESMPIRSVRELLAAIAAGGRIVFTPKHELGEANQWRQYRVTWADGRVRAVETSVAIAAYRRKLIEVEHR